jgi:cytoskeletal protein CcmA (bactofilin family)
MESHHAQETGMHGGYCRADATATPRGRGTRKNLNLTSFGGIIRSGVYGHLILNGVHTIEGGVRFKRLTVNGQVRGPQYVGGHIVFVSGELISDGDVQVRRISGHGRMLVMGRLRCELLDFTGEIKTARTLHCMQRMNLHGSLNASGGVTADHIEICGVAEATMMHSRITAIAPFESKLFKRLRTRAYYGPSRVRTIHSGRLTARKLVCSHIRVDSATLLDGCRIEYAEFQDELELDRSSSVALFTDHSQRTFGSPSERVRQA